MPKKKKKSGGGGGGSKNSVQPMPQGYDKTAAQYDDWNSKFKGSYDSAESYGQNNRWATGAQDWYDNQLSGNMENNPWMSRLYGQTEGLDMDQGMGYLNQYLQGGGPDSWNDGSGRSYGGGGGGGGGGGSSSSSRDGGNIPDSTVGDKFFSKHLTELFDAARLDPANDPTMQPMVDNIQREADESYWRQVTDLANQAEGAGRYGGGLYQGMRASHADEFNEALTGTLAQQYSQAREAALQRQMEALGLVNTRDIAEGQIAAQKAAARSSGSGAAYSAQLGYDAQMDANRLQAIQMMLGAGQFGMQMGGQMGEVMQNGQIAANQIGQGWAQLGQHGYDQSAVFGQLGLAGLEGVGGLYTNSANFGLQRDQMNATSRANQQRLAQQQRQWQDGAQSREIQDMINLMTGLGGGGGSYAPYQSGQSGAEPEGFNWEDILGGGLVGAGTYYNNQNR